MPDFHFEKALEKEGLIFGIDEAGRGPWCGPVVAACVSWPHFEIDPALALKIDDSKKLSVSKREELFELIIKSNAIIGIGQASAQEIDDLNILQATFLAMNRALEQALQKTSSAPAGILIDGNRLPKNWAFDCPIQTLIKGDHLSLSIAGASIIAKVTRDRLMQDLHHTYPQYGWNKNAGYGTKEHILAIQEYGITPEHRKSYAPIRAYMEQHPIK